MHEEEAEDSDGESWSQTQILYKDEEKEGKVIQQN